jgi:hypothetical protein
MHTLSVKNTLIIKYTYIPHLKNKTREYARKLAFLQFLSSLPMLP